MQKARNLKNCENSNSLTKCFVNKGLERINLPKEQKNKQNMKGLS